MSKCRLAWSHGNSRKPLLNAVHTRFRHRLSHRSIGMASWVHLRNIFLDTTFVFYKWRYELHLQIKCFLLCSNSFTYFHQPSFILISCSEFKRLNLKLTLRWVLKKFTSKNKLDRSFPVAISRRSKLSMCLGTGFRILTKKNPGYRNVDEGSTREFP